MERFDGRLTSRTLEVAVEKVMSAEEGQTQCI